MLNSQSILRCDVVLIVTDFAKAAISLECSGFSITKEEMPDDQDAYADVKRIGATEVKLHVGVSRQMKTRSREYAIEYFKQYQKADTVFTFSNAESIVPTINSLTRVGDMPFICFLPEGAMLEYGWLDTAIFYANDIVESAAVFVPSEIDGMQLSGVLGNSSDEFRMVWRTAESMLPDAGHPMVVSRKAWVESDMLDVDVIDAHGAWQDWSNRTRKNKKISFGIPSKTCFLLTPKENRQEIQLVDGK